MISAIDETSQPSIYQSKTGKSIYTLKLKDEIITKELKTLHNKFVVVI